MKVLKRAVQMCHEIISSVVREGDIAIDCTAGNGNDTAFLAELVGDTGKVISFDIQSTAIESTKNRLNELNLLHRVELIHDSHENIDKYINKNIKAAVFNLGYLPKGDHSIVTKPESTINCLRKILDLLQPGGIVCVAIYYGHEGGEEEKNAVLNYVSSLDQNLFAAQKMEFINLVNCPPILISIEREVDK